MLDITQAEKIPGFMSPSELTWLAEKASTAYLIAEIGCWQGRSTRVLADHTPGVVFAIDHFLGSPELLYELADKPPYWLYKNFTMHIIDRDNVIPVRRSSREAARLFSPLRFDLIFIDAAHDYDSVREDIRWWQPMAKPGAILCGHDYSKDAPDVEVAVRELLPSVERVPETSLWYAQL